MSRTERIVISIQTYGRTDRGLKRKFKKAIMIIPVNTGFPIKKDCDFNSGKNNKVNNRAKTFAVKYYRTIRLIASVFVRDINVLCNSVLFILAANVNHF